MKSKEEYRKYRREYQRNNPDYVKRCHISYRYGLTTERFDEMGKSQKGKCAICLRPSIKLQVDHDHQYGNVRQLLCPTCNQGLAKFQDSPEILKNALNYLTKWKTYGRKKEIPL